MTGRAGRHTLPNDALHFNKRKKITFSKLRRCTIDHCSEVTPYSQGGYNYPQKFALYIYAVQAYVVNT